jgi:DNA-binding MarR family transcriptional regulator
MADISDLWQRAHHMLRSARQIINTDLRPLNLTSAEGNILLHLLIQGHELGQEQLVEQLDVSKPAVSRSLDSLEAKGYVAIRPDPLDRRVHTVRLTDSAREIGPAVAQAYNRLYAIAIQDISPEELDTFIQVFSRMSKNFSRAHPDKPQETEIATC